MAESFVRKLTICNSLDPETVASINKICVFNGDGSDDTSCIYIDEDDDVFAMGYNTKGCLGLGDEYSRGEPVAIVQLCKQHVKTIAFGDGGHILAVTECGRLFSWRYNAYGQLGNGNCNNVLIPVQVTTNLQDKKIVQASCGYLHSMALSDEGEIFAWGCNDYGQLGSGSATVNQSSPHIVSLGKAVSIACGNQYSVALLGNGEVYSWGDNRWNQLGLNSHDSYVLTPSKVEALCGVLIKQLDLLLKAGKVFMWGECDDQEIITSPLLTEASTTDEIVVLLSHKKMTWRMFYVATAASSTITSDIAKSFDESTTSDIKFIAEGREIYCHKAILKIRCEHFRSMFQSHWDEDNKDSIEVPYPYHVFRAFLYYLYTDSVDLCPEGAIGLLELADSYCEQVLKRKCEQVIKQGINVESVAMLYAAAIKFDAKKLEDVCFKFSLKNMTAVTQTTSFAQLDESTYRRFIVKSSQAGAYKT